MLSGNAGSVWTPKINTDGLVFYAPLWHPSLAGDTFQSMENKVGQLCTVTGAVWGKYGRIFDGTDDQIVVGAETDWDTLLDGEHAFSIAFWMNSAMSASYTVISKGNDPSFIGIYLNATNFIFDIKNGSSANDLQCFFAHNHANTNAFVIVTYDGSKSVNGVKIYVNDVDKTLTKPINSLSTALATNVNLIIGTGIVSSWDYTGILGDFFIYNRVTSSATERTNLRLTTKWRYQS